MASSYTALSPSDFIYTKPCKSRRGSNTMWIRDKATNRNVSFHLPRMRAPFAISKFDDSKPTFNLELNVDDSKIKDFLSEWDAANLSAVTAFKSELFRKGTSDAMVESQYRTLAQQKNPSYPPLLRVKVGDRTEVEVVKDGKIMRRKATLDDIVKGCDVQCSLQCVGLYFCNGIWGCTLVCKGLRVFPPTKKKLFGDDIPMEEEDDDIVESKGMDYGGGDDDEDSAPMDY